jgi:SAM-dependent methyltransferase
MTFADSKQRFSNRAADYVRYRPRYPESIVDFLRSECGLRPEHAIADIGSGTGFLSELFVKNGNRVFGVEPNEAMRQAGEDFLARYPNFVGVDGSAEATTLATASVDFITAGQAFHWFEPAASRREFQRILRPPGWVAILWYHRPLNKSSSTDAYEDFLIRFGTDYEKVRDAYPKNEDVVSFLGHENVSTRDFSAAQEFTREQLNGLLKSTSFVPDQNHANYAPMMAELGKLFHENETNGRVRLEMTTTVYCGRLDGNGTNS